MYSFSPRSLRKLETCDERLQVIMLDLIQIVDVSILEGFRSKERQTEMYDTKKSKLQWPDSNHNSEPSRAIDVAPYPIIWPDALRNPSTWHKHLARFYYMGGLIIAIGASKGVKIRWGGDWNRNNSFTDQSFDDLPHFEIAR